MVSFAHHLLVCNCVVHVCCYHIHNHIISSLVCTYAHFMHVIVFTFPAFYFYIYAFPHINIFCFYLQQVFRFSPGPMVIRDAVTSPALSRNSLRVLVPPTLRDRLTMSVIFSRLNYGSVGRSYAARLTARMRRRDGVGRSYAARLVARM